MAALDKIKKALWNTSASDEDENEYHPEKTERVAQAAAATPTETQPKPKGVSTTKMRDHLASIIEKANLPGFDYFELKEAMQELESDVPDEAARMRAVYKTAKSMNVTSQTLIDAANHYITELSKERDNFEAALVEKVNNEIGDQKKQLESASMLVKENQRKIEELTKQIDQANRDAAKLSSEINAAEAKVQKARTDFITAYDETVNVIKSDIKKIKTVLGVNK